MTDVRVKRDGAVVSVDADTDEGEVFVDAWVLGVLTVVDSGRVTLTAEVVDEFTREAQARGLSVEVSA